MNIHIVYEDDHLVAVNKPAGLLVHGDGRSNEPTLADWILKHYPALRNVGEPVIQNSGILRPGIVHRLDKETSGILIIAKNQPTYLFLKRQFQNRKVKKTYKAIVYGSVKNKRSVIDTPIARSAKDFRLYTAGRRRRGKEREALTEYQVLVRSEAYSYLEVYPRTGRTHQIRVHLKSIGHPVVCDTLYAPKRECPEALGSLALHALSLEFITPANITLNLEAPLPRKFSRFIKTHFQELQGL